MLSPRQKQLIRLLWDTGRYTKKMLASMFRTSVNVIEETLVTKPVNKVKALWGKVQDIFK